MDHDPREDAVHDISEQLDAELDQLPEPTFGLEATLAAGRRAVRRRRLASGTAAVAVLAVVGGSALALSGGDGIRQGSDRGQVANQPSASSSPAPTSAAEPSGQEFRLTKGELASYDGQGALVVRDGWRVTEQITNPLQRTAPARSVGLALTKGSETYWYLLDYDDTGMSAASDPAGKAFATLGQWVDDQVELQELGESGEGGGEQAFVEFRADGGLRAAPGVTIVEQRAGIDLGAGFAPASRTAVAQLDVDGRLWFVSARRIPGSEPEFFPVNTAAAGTTLDSFVAYSRAQYDSGEGVR